MSLENLSAGSDELKEEDVCAHLIACELALLDPAIRCDRAQMEALLAEDFLEFGSSGLVWDRKAILDLLESEDYCTPTAEELKCARIGAGVALVTYRAIRTDQAGTRSITLRSSVWKKETRRWRVRFHQGTRVP